MKGKIEIINLNVTQNTVSRINSISSRKERVILSSTN